MKFQNQFYAIKYHMAQLQRPVYLIAKYLCMLSTYDYHMRKMESFPRDHMSSVHNSLT
jgi:hypothetical protein